MVKTLNTCSDLNIKYQKTLLGCKNKFRASITVGQGQVLMRVSIGRIYNFQLNQEPETGMEWAVLLRHNGMFFDGIKLNSLESHKTLAVENILANDEDHYEAYITLIKTSSSAERPTTQEQLERDFGQEHPIAIIFEVC